MAIAIIFSLGFLTGFVLFYWAFQIVLGKKHRTSPDDSSPRPAEAAPHPNEPSRTTDSPARIEGRVDVVAGRQRTANLETLLSTVAWDQIRADFEARSQNQATPTPG